MATTITTKNGLVKIYAETLEAEALDQIEAMANSPIGENAHIRIMPDAHAGAGCVIGTTMLVGDKVCPNVVGVDIGCGVDLVKTNIQFENRLQELDTAIRKVVPHGFGLHKEKQPYDFTKLKCYNQLDGKVLNRSQYSLGTLGGGNHFIETYANGYISVHSGSRNIGLAVAKHYQDIAEKTYKKAHSTNHLSQLKKIPLQDRQKWLEENHPTPTYPISLAFLEGQKLENYLHDIAIIQEFAKKNREKMVANIVAEMSGEIVGKSIKSIHNYIDIENRILRKGAIQAYNGQELVIPLNMRDGVLVCVGKGNKDWNFSAPHGAGRLYSRSKARKELSLMEYEATMKGIYSTCIDKSTIDEAPFAYKDTEEIKRLIIDTVDIKLHLKPIYNFKSTN